jgi:hypothetical protein
VSTEASQVRPRISLLHATYRRESTPLEVKASWLEHADRPDLVDYIFAMDADDEAAIEQTEGHPRVVNPPSEGWATAVRNWNAAAKMASGDLLMVIADDLFPPQGWDTTLVGIIRPLDPATTAFAVKITDAPLEGDILMRHPVVSRAFYERYGLFSDSYHGVYCDDDLTLRAFWRAVILDGKSLVFDHRHFSYNESFPRSESHDRINQPREYQHGRVALRGSWSPRERNARIWLFSPAAGAQLSESMLRTFRRKKRIRETVAFCPRAVRWTVHLLLRPRKLLRRLSGPL